MVRKIIIGVITGIILSIVGAILDVVFGLIDVRGIARSVASAVYCVMTIHVQLWAIPIIAVPTLAVIFLAFRRKKPRSPDNIPQMPDWYDFTRMEHKGRLFEWKYKRGTPYNFVELCVNCKCRVNGTECEYCGRRTVPYWNYITYESVSIRLADVVIARIEDGTYREIMAKHQLT